MTTIIVGHVFFPDSFSAMVLTFVGGRRILFLQGLVNGSHTRSAQVGLVWFRWYPHWKQKNGQKNPLPACRLWFNGVYSSREVKGLLGFLFWQWEQGGVSGRPLSLGPSFLTCNLLSDSVISIYSHFLNRTSKPAFFPDKDPKSKLFKAVGPESSSGSALHHQVWNLTDMSTKLEYGLWWGGIFKNYSSGTPPPHPMEIPSNLALKKSFRNRFLWLLLLLGR